MHATAELIRISTNAINNSSIFATPTSTPHRLWHSTAVGILPEKSDLDRPRRKLTKEAASLLREMQDFDRF